MREESIKILENLEETGIWDKESEIYKAINFAKEDMKRIQKAKLKIESMKYARPYSATGRAINACIDEVLSVIKEVVV